MTDQERFQRYADLQDLISSRGYRWFMRMFDEQIKEDQETFLVVDTDEARFEKQVRLKLLQSLRGWAEEEISRCHSMEKMKR